VRTAYFPRLDGIRAIAVGGVLWEHFSGHANGFGSIGVRIFFVLSGFLITGILLNYRKSGASLQNVAIAFYWRRALRIFPVFYLALIVGAMLGVSAGRVGGLMDLAFLTNIHVFRIQSWTATSHLWSLAVEEQFYLLAFPLIFFVPGKRLVACLTAICALSFGFDAVMSALGFQYFTILLPGAAHGLAAGALLACAQHKKPTWRDHLSRLTSGRVMAASVILSGLCIWLQPGGGTLRLLTLILATDVMAICLITRGVGDGHAWKWLAHPAMTYIGQISYGLYVYHIFVKEIAFKFFPLFAETPTWISGPILASASVAIASLSWLYFEQPILRHKSRFPKDDSAAEVAQQSAQVKQ